MIFAALHRLELPAIRQVNRISRSRLPRLLFSAASRLGDGLVWYLLIALLPLVNGAQDLPISLLMLACGICCTLTYKLIKAGTRRPRPCHAEPGLNLSVAPLDLFSFPSGHTLHAVSFTVVACHFHPALAWFLAPFTVLVAASRVVLGLHYPSDVLAGALIGFGYAALAVAFFG